MQSFMSVHNHSEYSNLRFCDSTIKVGSLVDRAIELGYNGVCLTDHEALSGHVKFLQRYKELKEQGKLPDGFKIGLGNEIYLCNRHQITTSTGGTIQNAPYYHFLLVAKDKHGHKQLRELSSTAWEKIHKSNGIGRAPTYKEDIEDIIGADPGHVIASTACLGGELSRMILSGTDPIPFLEWCKQVFGKENFFLEIQPRFYEQGYNEHDQVIVNKEIMRLSDKLDVPYIVTTDSHYLREEDRLLHNVFLNSDPKNSGQRELSDFYDTAYMMDLDELKAFLLSHLTNEQTNSAIDNTQLIYDQIEEYDLNHRVIVPADPYLPQFEVKNLFADWYEKYPYIRQFAESDEEQERYFLYLIEKGFEEKKQEFTDETVGRINEELRTIALISEKLEQPLANYYVFVRQLIHNILWRYSFVGAARGSVTGFYTAWLTDIIQVNPLEWGLSAWRHLQESRPELPDIDVDVESNLRPLIFKEMAKYYGEDRVLQTLTYRTLGSKSAVQSACKGLGIDDAEANVIASFVPFERGSSWPLRDCFEGNPEHGREPVQAFIERVNATGEERLQEAMYELEGIIVGRGIHASSQYVFNQPFLEQNSMMRAPNGTKTTAFNMEESDMLGGLKMDLLVIEALDKLHVMMNMLFEDGVIEDKGSVKANYDAYLHPALADYTNQKVWDMIANNSIPELFQCDTDVGKNTMAKIKPTTIQQMASANSLMRLMPQGNEPSPTDVYVAYKNDISRWYREMEDFGLTPEEIDVLEPLLLPEYGVAAVQESIMMLVMDPKIAGFSMKEANMLRKAVAKKKPKLIEQVKQLYYEKGKELGTSQTMLDYVWNKQISRQLGYSFSINHTTPYSIIGFQQAAFVAKYGLLYWGAAILTVDAGAVEAEDVLGNLSKNTDYSKVACAVATLKDAGLKISLPDINRAGVGFIPDAKNNAIMFSLKAIRDLGEEQARCIVARRPYDSFDDFLQKCGDTVKKAAVVQLIKAGAFDELDPRPREQLMRDYIGTTSDCQIKKLNLTHVDEILESGLANLSPRDIRFLKYERMVRKNIAIKGHTQNSTWVYVYGEDMTEKEYVDQLDGLIKPNFVKTHTDGYTIVQLSAFIKARDTRLTTFKKEILNNPEFIRELCAKRADKYIREKLPGNRSTWEMSALLFYDSPHELEGIDRERYHIDNFFELPEDPPQFVTTTYSGETYQQYSLTRIAGTVLGKDADKHTVKILTTDGLVTVKLYKEAFTEYNRQVTSVLFDGKSTVRERSWFQRGNKLMFTGFRRGEQFVVRTYKNNPLKNNVCLIKGLNTETGEVMAWTERWDMRERRKNQDSTVQRYSVPVA